jgi:hypothetical protein
MNCEYKYELRFGAVEKVFFNRKARKVGTKFAKLKHYKYVLCVLCVKPLRPLRLMAFDFFNSPSFFMQYHFHPQSLRYGLCPHAPSAFLKTVILIQFLCNSHSCNRTICDSGCYLPVFFTGNIPYRINIGKACLHIFIRFYITPMVELQFVTE